MLKKRSRYVKKIPLTSFIKPFLIKDAFWYDHKEELFYCCLCDGCYIFWFATNYCSFRDIECILDYCRKLQYDASFKDLPGSIQKAVDGLLERLRKEQGLILHNG